MTDREKLIKLIGQVHDEGLDYSDVVCAYATSNERLADHLLANGVTFATDNNVGSKWITASEPPKEWKDENGDAINYLIYSPGIGVDIGNWIEPAKAWFCLGVPFKVTHWMQLPNPPKEVDK